MTVVRKTTAKDSLATISLSLNGIADCPEKAGNYKTKTASLHTAGLIYSD